MDIQDHCKTAAGDEGHKCHRCGWAFPNSHPSSRHRRAHKRICGTIEGYTTKLIESEAISDHSDEDKERTPSPKIEKGIIKESGNSGGGTEDDLFSDAVTEFSDSGISPGATTKLLDSSPIEVFETPDSHSKDAAEENDSQIKLLDSDMKPLVEDKLIDLVECCNMKPDSANTMDVNSKNVDGFDKDQEEQAVYVLSVPSDIPHSETLIDDFKDHQTFYSMILDHDDTFEVKVAETKPLEMSKTVPESTDNLIEAKVSVDERTETTTSKEINEEKLEIDDSDPVLTKEDPASEIIKEPESGFEAEQKIVASVEVDSKESGNLGTDKLMPDKDEQWPTASGSSSRNSLEGNWGSVSVLSTASIDAENAHSVDKSRLGKCKSEGQSLVLQVKEEEIVDEKASEMQNSEAKMVDQSEGKKANKEAIAKLTNSTTTPPPPPPPPLKNVAKSREAEKSNSPPKYTGDRNKVRKKNGKGRGSWVPFACCSSVNVN